MDISKMPLPEVSSIPREDDEPVFREPWEARIFAIIVSLHNQGMFEWKAFQELLIEEIGRTESAGDFRDYYANWTAAAEKLIQSLDIAHQDEIDVEVSKLLPVDRTIVLPKH